MIKTFRKTSVIGISLVLVAVFTSLVYPHCQIPCGIYNDPARFDMIAEHITTIEKSIGQITELSKQKKPNMNQIVRWVQNKEKHADELSEIVTYYFMAQRVKPAEKPQGKAYEEYVRKLTLLHEMLVCSMKTKQTTDMANVEKLKALSIKFKDIYLQEHSH
jgi:nickel superoxide dismutase